jgi:hypothetical protein
MGRDPPGDRTRRRGRRTTDHPGKKTGITRATRSG